MIIAISSDKKDLKEPVSEIFGRSLWFCLYNTETQKVEFLENVAGATIQNAGAKTVDFLQKLGVNAVLSGRFGTRTTVLLRKNNIQLIIPQRIKTLNEIINQLKNKKS
ncbi:MAG: NifB/NifX family molybdenum-iron cluster-binding protein [Dysgonamonadaceae bacterium]